MKNSHKKGFSLLEMIVVIAVIALVLPAVFAIVFSILKQQVSVYKLTEEKRQADNILNILKNNIRPAVGVYSDMIGTEVCTGGRYPGNTNTFSHGGTDPNYPMLFKDKLNHYFQFYINSSNNEFYYQIDNTANPVTNSKVTVSSFNIACEKDTSYSPSVLDINFSVSYGTTTTDTDTIPIVYHTRIVIRNGSSTPD